LSSEIFRRPQKASEGRFNRGYAGPEGGKQIQKFSA